MTAPVLVALGLLMAAGCSSAGDHGSQSVPTTASSDSNASSTRGGQAGGSAGCGKPPAADLHGPAGRDDDVVRTITSSGQPRLYRLGVPRRSDNRKPQPLVLNFHGSGSSAAAQTIYSQFSRKAEARNYVVVAPDAIAGQWQLFPTDGSKGADLAFVKAVLAEVSGQLCIDQRRVFTTGISLGSAMATDLACTLLDQVAAVGNVAEEVVFPGCHRVLPVIAFHGTADPLVPYKEGDIAAGRPNSGLPGTEHNMAGWAQLNHCDPQPKVTDIGTEVVHSVWPGCRQGSAVELYTVNGGGHTWPGSPIKVDFLGHTTDQVDATTLILDFFDAHPLADR